MKKAHHRFRGIHVFLFSFVLALIFGVFGLVSVAITNSEQLDNHWVVAEFKSAESATVTEVLDYQSGTVGRHGIYRDVPGLTPEGLFSVTSPSASSEVAMVQVGTFDQGYQPGDELRVRIGNPDETISGAHRYTLEYALDSLINDQEMAWDAVGYYWEMPIESAEVHMVAPFELLAPTCHFGGAGRGTECSVEVVAPGYLRATVVNLPEQTGLTLRAQIGDDLPGELVLPVPPSLPPQGLQISFGWWLNIFFGSMFALWVGGMLALFVLRRLGSEQVREGGATTAAFGGGAPGERVRKVTVDELMEMAALSFAPPSELTAAQGGVLYFEKVEHKQKVAWLLEEVLAGNIEAYEDPERSAWVLKDTSDGNSSPLLGALFADGEEIVLSDFDSKFATFWGGRSSSGLENHLQEWRTSSGLWVEKSSTRVPWVKAVGTLLLVFGVFAPLPLAAIFLPSPLPGFFASFAFFSGFGLFCALAADELHSRSPRGTGLWLQVEGFRRFLAESEAEHVQRAAEQGRLREYTAWAAALGEYEHWHARLAAAALDDVVGAGDLAFVGTVHSLDSATSTSSTSPSSSGGGGGGGGGW